MNAVSSITSSVAAQAVARIAFPVAGAGSVTTWVAEAQAPQTSTPQVTPPQQIQAAAPKKIDAADIAQCQPASLEVPIEEIVDVSLHGSNGIGTLSQLRSDKPEFLTIMTLVMRNSGTNTPAVRSYSSYAATQIADPAATDAVGESLDLAA